MVFELWLWADIVILDVFFFAVATQKGDSPCLFFIDGIAIA